MGGRTAAGRSDQLRSGWTRARAYGKIGDEGGDGGFPGRGERQTEPKIMTTASASEIVKISAWPSSSIAQRAVETGGRSTGFDYLRILLATLVVLAHSRAITVGLKFHTFVTATTHAAAVPHPPLLQPLVWTILPAFFALSGYLVAGSLERSKTTTEFAMLRLLRIWPALIVETVLAAFLMGPFVTEFPLRAYFSNPDLWAYPWNIVGYIHYTLPGVFLHNPWPLIVNSQLWTIPSEFECYALLVIASIFRFAKWKSSTVILAAVYLLFYTVVFHAPPHRWSEGATAAAPTTLVLAFLVGVTMFKFKELIPLNFGLFLLAGVVSFPLMWNGEYQYLATIPIAYATVYAGLTNFPKTIINRTGDYSYGVYLYGFPIQQLLAYLLPQSKIWPLNFVIALMCAGLFAAFSWHVIEHRALMSRGKVIPPVVNFVTRTSARIWQIAGQPIYRMLQSKSKSET